MSYNHEDFTIYDWPDGSRQDVMYLPIQPRVDRVVKLFGEDWFKGKNILELGACTGKVGKKFEELGAIVTYADARQTWLDQIDSDRKYRIDQNTEWNIGKKFDLIIHWSVLYHLGYWQRDLRCCMEHTDKMILETGVRPIPWVDDGEDGGEPQYIRTSQRPDNLERKFNGVDGWWTIATPDIIEKELIDIGWTVEDISDSSLDTEDFQQIIEKGHPTRGDSPKYQRHIYSWTDDNWTEFDSIEPYSTMYRRMWYVHI